jgi:hypothetical protein
MTSTGVVFLDEQVEDTIHNNMVFGTQIGVDGSTVDVSQGGPLSANLTNIQIHVNDTDNVFDSRLGIAWWRWINTTEQGALIYDAPAMVYKPDERNIEIQGPLKIKNTKVDSELTITNGIWKHYQGESIIAADSYTIVWVPNDRLYNSNNDQIASILTKTMNIKLWKHTPPVPNADCPSQSIDKLRPQKVETTFVSFVI